MMIGALVILSLAVVGLIGWIFVRPWARMFLVYAAALGDLMKHPEPDIRDAAADALTRHMPNDLAIPGA